MPDYLVEIERTHTRTYEVKASSPEEALALLANDPYHEYEDEDGKLRNSVEFVEDEMDGTEHGDTAVVYADDDTRTVLLDVASDVLGKE